MITFQQMQQYKLPAHKCKLQPGTSDILQFPATIQNFIPSTTRGGVFFFTAI